VKTIRSIVLLVTNSRAGWLANPKAPSGSVASLAGRRYPQLHVVRRHYRSRRAAFTLLVRRAAYAAAKVASGALCPISRWLANTAQRIPHGRCGPLAAARGAYAFRCQSRRHLTEAPPIGSHLVQQRGQTGSKVVSGGLARRGAQLTIHLRPAAVAAELLSP
jgi:hypothetical protein